MLPDYMSKIISEGIKSPAYEQDKEGNNIVAVISPSSPFGQQFAEYFTVKSYPRDKDVVLYTDADGFACLADENGQPIENGAVISAKILYEKDLNGNYVKDADTNAYIVKYAYTDGQGNMVNDSHIISNKGVAESSGVEKKNGIPISAPAVISVPIYRFDKQPAPLLLDDYGNATLTGVYLNESNQMPITVKIGQNAIPVFRFAREGNDYGVLFLNEDGTASFAQVSFIPVIIKYGLIMLGITFLISISGITANFLSSNVSLKTGRDIRSALYGKISGFSYLDYGKIGTASLITRTTNDVTQIQTMFFMMFRMVIMPPIMFIGGLIMALNKNVQMTLVLAVSIPLILVLIIVTGKFVVPLFKSMQKKIDALTLVSRENLTGVRVIRAFNRENTEDLRFEKANKDVTDTAVKANRIMSVLSPAVMLIMTLTTLSVTAIAVFIAKSDIMGTSYADFANMMAVTQYIMQIMISIMFIMMIFVLFPRASASAARINEVLEIEPALKDKGKANSVSGVKGEVVFENVSFFFEGSETPVLSDITFRAEGGKFTAVVGSTGSGKSTLINLIARLFDASSGKILIDGVDIKDYSLNDLRKKISFVPQKSLLFTGTIAENLRFGDENADEDKILNALKTAQAEEFVAKLPEGINSRVEHGGVNFSGGQKQRLSIARALMKDAEIYIFDDSFSALDFKTDSNLRKALKKELKGKTVFIVAQRIGTVMNADNIIVLDEGRIVGQGRHKELMKTCSVYREIALSQLSEEELQ
jgi:ATP-binding cassette subfamily B protein